MLRLVLAPDALTDLRDILRWSRERFGAEAAKRYRTLLLQALQDLLEDPRRAGSQERPDILADGVRSYHLLFSRRSVAGEPVKTPRHFVIYRCRDGELQVARLLHDSRDLPRHLPEEYRR